MSLQPALFSTVDITQLTALETFSHLVWKVKYYFLTQSQNIPAISQQLCSNFLHRDRLKCLADKGGPCPAMASFQKCTMQSLWGVQRQTLFLRGEMKIEMNFELISKTTTEKSAWAFFPCFWHPSFLKTSTQNSGPIRCFNSSLRESLVNGIGSEDTISYTKGSTFCKYWARKTVSTRTTRAAGN